MLAILCLGRPHRTKRFLSGYYIVAFVMLVVQCSTRDPEAAQHYAAAHSTGLVKSTRPLWAKYSSSGDIPESEYTPEIRTLAPYSVTAGKAGLSLYIRTSWVHVTWIFIRHDRSFPVTPSTAPPDSDEMTCRRLGDDVFWFSRPR